MTAPPLELAFEGHRFLGFLGAVGLLRIVAREAPSAQLGWDPERRARLDGVPREQLLEIVRVYLEKREFDPSVTSAVNEGAKRTKPSSLPWDVCEGGNPPLGKALTGILEDLRKHPAKVEQAIFGPWKRKDKGDPLGWEPNFRDHALRTRAPTDDQTYRENGATWLGWEGIPVFGTLDQHPVGWKEEGRRSVRLTWPVWSSGATLLTVRALLRASPSGWARSGVREAWQVERVSTEGRSDALTVPRLLSLAART